MEEIRKEEGYLVSEGIRRLRTGQVKKSPGFDGEYGTISLFDPEEIENPNGQMSFFNEWEREKEPGIQAVDSCISGGLTQKKTEELSGLSVEDREESVAEKQKETIQQLNEKQKQAAETIARRIVILTNKQGKGVRVTAIDRPFSFSALHYTVDDIYKTPVSLCISF